MLLPVGQGIPVGEDKLPAASGAAGVGTSSAEGSPAVERILAASVG